MHREGGQKNLHASLGGGQKSLDRRYFRNLLGKIKGHVKILFANMVIWEGYYEDFLLVPAPPSLIKRLSYFCQRSDDLCAGEGVLVLPWRGSRIQPAPLKMDRKNLGPHSDEE